MKKPVGLAVGAALLVALVPSTADADVSVPAFGLGTDENGVVLVAATSEGVARSDGTIVAELPNVSDVTASDQGWWWAITGGGLGDGDAMLYQVWADGTVEAFADLGAYEETYNPHPAFVDSNPFSVVDFGGGEALVADAAGNSILKVNKHGKVKLVATLPDELVSTANAKAIVEEVLSNLFQTEITCDALPPGMPPEAVDVCNLPPMIPAEAVATSVAVGPDGAIYAGELKGFPAPVEESRVWRIEPHARNADCARSPLCSVAYDGLTSVVDLAFSDDGTLHVAELSEKSWFAFELGFFAGLPIDPGLGAINACNGVCSSVASVPFLTAITFDGSGELWYANFVGTVATP